MKGCDSIKIETVGDSPTNQLNVEICCSSLNAHRLQLGGLTLTQSISSPIDTSSIALTNYNFQCTSILQSPSQLKTTNNKDVQRSPVATGRVDFLSNLLQRSTVDPLYPPEIGGIDSQLPMMNRICSYFEYCSQSTACIATSCGECGLYTSLDKLWYTYSYIYKRVSSITTTIIVPFFLLFLVAVLLMPTTDTPTTSSSIVSPSPLVVQLPSTNPHH